MQRPDSATSCVALLCALISEKPAPVIDALSVPPASALGGIVATLRRAAFGAQFETVRRDDVALMAKTPVTSNWKFGDINVGTGAIIFSHAPSTCGALPRVPSAESAAPIPLAAQKCIRVSVVVIGSGGGPTSPVNARLIGLIMPPSPYAYPDTRSAIADGSAHLRAHA